MKDVVGRLTGRDWDGCTSLNCSDPCMSLISCFLGHFILQVILWFLTGMETILCDSLAALSDTPQVIGCLYMVNRSKTGTDWYWRVLDERPA